MAFSFISMQTWPLPPADDAWRSTVVIFYWPAQNIVKTYVYLLCIFHLLIACHFQVNRLSLFTCSVYKTHTARLWFYIYIYINIIMAVLLHLETESYAWESLSNTGYS